MKGIRFGILLLLVLIFGCSGGGGNSSDGSSSRTLVSLTMAPADSTVTVNGVVAFSAVGTYSDGSRDNLTALVTWSSSNRVVADIDAAGKATARTVGSTVIGATYGAVSAAPTTLTVSAPAIVLITIDPPVPALGVGTVQQLSATGTYSDGSKFDLTETGTWSSSAQEVAEVDQTGKVTAHAAGTATIRIVSGAGTGQVSVSVKPATLVSLSIDPPNPTFALGTNCQLTATGIFSDGSSQDLTHTVAWSPQDPAVAQVSNAAGSEGKVSGTAVGSTTVTASLNGVHESVTLVVTPAHLVALAVTPGRPTLALGSGVRFSAVGTFSDGSQQELGDVIWSSSDAGVASISNAAGSSGTATTVAVGSTTISATSGTVQGNTTFTVTPAYLVSIALAPANQVLPAGNWRQLTATGTYSDGTRQDITSSATWTSSVPAVATVGNSGASSGKVTALTVGTATVTATLPLTAPLAGAISGSARVEVTPATLVSIALSPSTFTLPLGTTKRVTATGTYSDGSTQDLTRSVTWGSSAPAVARVGNSADSAGKVTPLSVGETTLSAAWNGASATGTVAVSPLNVLDLQGTWVGTYTIFDDPGNPAEIGTYAFTLVLAQSGSSVTATPTLRGGTAGIGELFGTVVGDQFSFSFTYLSPTNGYLMTDTGTARAEGDTMTGEVVENFAQGYNCSYRFSVTRQQ